MSSIFFSYDPSDADFAQRLITDLRAVEIQVTSRYDEDILPLENIKTLLVMVSPNSMAAEDVQNDIEFAASRHIRIIPIMSQLARPVPTLRTPIVDMSTPKRYRANLPFLIDTLNSDVELIYSSFFRQQTVDNSNAVVGVDLGRYVPVLSAIVAPIANANGDGPPTQRRHPIHIWQQLASAIPLFDVENAPPFALTRLLPPTLEALKATVNAAPYQVLHLHTYNLNDALVLEDEYGKETPIYANSLINALIHSQVKVLILVGNLPLEEAETLLEESPVQAIIQLDAQLDEFTTTTFTTHTLLAMGLGKSVQEAYHLALQELAKAEIHIEHQTQLLHLPSVDSVHLDLPSPNERAFHSLIFNGLPPMRGVPLFPEFVGHRRELLELNREIDEDQYRQIALYGPIEVGKTWLAAEYALRFAWRYPDGVLWMRISAQTKSEDVIGQLLALLELPPTTNWNTLREILRERSVLIVLDQLDEWDDPLEVGELADFIARLDHIGGTKVLLTAWGPVQPITYTSGTEENYIEALTEDEARYLAYRYIEYYDINDEFTEPAKLDQFLDKTKGIPWLIREGMQFIQRLGYGNGIEALSDIVDDVADPYERHMSHQINVLSDESFQALRLLQGFSDGFTYRWLKAAIPEFNERILQELLTLDMLNFDGRLYRVPPIIHNYLIQYAALSEEEQAAIDERVIEYLLEEQV